MMFPLVRDLAAEGIPVRLTCGVLGFSPQAFYKWRARPCSDRDWHDAQLTNAIVDVHVDDPEFGYRFIADELEAAGHRVGERRVWRLCRRHRIWSTTTKKGRRHGKTPGPAVHDDLVQRQFNAPAPDVVWVTDNTEHPTVEGKLYCCAIKDLFSNRIVGYALDERMTAKLAVSALRAAIARRQPNGTVVVHSDRGSQGELNWSSQHLDDVEVCGGDDAGAAAGGSALSGTGSLAGAADGGVAGGSGQVLGSDRSRGEDRGRRCGGGRVIPRCVPVVSSRWRREPVSALERVGPLPVVRGA
jgi:putative transposase